MVRVWRKTRCLLYRVEKGQWCVSQRDAARFVNRTGYEHKLGIKLRYPDLNLWISDELTEEACNIFPYLTDCLTIYLNPPSVGIEDRTVGVDEVTTLGRASLFAGGNCKLGMIVDYDREDIARAYSVLIAAPLGFECGQELTVDIRSGFESCLTTLASTAVIDT